MRKITYGCLTLVLLLLFLSGCGAQEENKHAAHNEMGMTDAPINSEAAASASPSPTDVVTLAPEPVETEKPKETEKPEATQKPAATEKATEATPKATASQPKPTPATPVKTEKPIKETEQPSDAVTVHTVEITNFAFTPEKLEISQGDIVTFINKDEVKHSATADNGQFDTELLAQDESMEVTFSDAGEFGYYCIPHPGMKGTIVVKEK
ncbi:cupredoxin domain-containing protein [Paenibacillus harenae]|uniref:cupredoxin domain-containing protein n=1 Tax=Paenibacillus harenae TaxID=306543 RepID=UPI0027951679|nr:cupredoxin family copper-binding protein [Paenibacillus harenae]MDQ0062967.1 plastocyanin [Paenibacillus harenae]